MTSRRILVVNADDYGLTPGVCTGILRGHRDGVVSSTSALVNAPAFDSHAGALRDSGLPAGLHLCFVGEDPPLLSAKEVPTLVERDGRFPATWRRFLQRAARGAIDPDDLRREARAQLEALLAHGMRPTHVDSHQNLHLWPTVTGVALELSIEHRIAAMRIAGSRRLAVPALGVRTLGAVARRRARRHGLVAPDASIGLDDAGSMTSDRFREAVRRLADGRGHADVTVHPGSDPDPDRHRYAWGYEWGRELEAVTEPDLTQWIKAQGFHLGSFGDLATA